MQTTLVAIGALRADLFILDTAVNNLTGTFANSEAPDEMPYKAVFHQGVLCLL